MNPSTPLKFFASFLLSGTLIFFTFVSISHASESATNGNQSANKPGAVGLIPCGFDTNDNNKLDEAEECTLTDVIVLGNNLINFAITLSVPIFILLFMYAGFLYMTANGNPGKISDAHGLFYKGIIGFVIILSAWLIVNLIVSSLLPEDSTIETFLSE